MSRTRANALVAAVVVAALAGCRASEAPVRAAVDQAPPVPSASASAPPVDASPPAAPLAHDFEPVWKSLPPTALPPHPLGWHLADCKEVVGSPSLALTFDSGRTLVESHTKRPEKAVVYDIVALDVPGALLAIVDDRLWASEDGGCRWAAVARTSATRLTPARGGLAYGWNRDGNDLSVLSLHGTADLPSPPAKVVALAVDAASASHLRVVTEAGLFDSTDGGATWAAPRGAAKRGPISVAVFAGDGLDHLLVIDHAADEDRPSLTRDGGKTWLSPAGFRSRRETHPLAWWAGSTTDPTVLWVMDDETGIYRSSDGGETFAFVAAPISRGEHRPHRIGVGAAPDPNVAVLHSYYAVFRLDVRTKKWKRHPPPLKPGRALHDQVGPHEWLTAATFVPPPPVDAGASPPLEGPVLAVGISTVVRYATDRD